MIHYSIIIATEEIETVIAHELGHFKKKHIIKNIIIGTVSSFLTLFIIALLYQNSISWFGFDSITQVSALPLLALWSMLIGIVQSPLGNILSRKFEYEADEYAINRNKKSNCFHKTLWKNLQNKILVIKNLIRLSNGFFIAILQLKTG